MLGIGEEDPGTNYFRFPGGTQSCELVEQRFNESHEKYKKIGRISSNIFLVKEWYFLCTTRNG